MRYYIEHLPMTIPMGVQSENNAEAVELDVSDWLARDGSLSFSVWVTRPGETEAYQAANATMKDGILYWWPTSADTAIAGEGRVEILAVSANRRMLSGWTATSIRETTTETTTDTPVDQRPWLDQALLASDEAKAAARSAADSADQAEGVVKKEIATLTKDIAYYNNGVNRPYIGTPVIGSQINDSTGMFEVTASANLIASEDYIRMKKGKKYFFATSSAVSFNVYFYDENKNYIRSFVPNSGLSSTTKIVNNTEYAYARIGLWKSGATLDDWNSITVVMNEKPRKIVFMGDSITAGIGVSKTCAMWLAEHYGWTCLNYGIAGTGYICGMQGANSMAGDGVEGVGKYRDITEVGDYLSRVSDLPADADLYVIGGGYNDWNTNNQIESFKKRAAAVYEAIMTKSPNARILVLTPTRQYTSAKDSRNPNAAGYTLEDYANVIIEVCESMSIPCVDLYHSGGLYPVNSAQSAVYYSDGLHPTSTGNRMIANVTARMCESLVWQII